MRQLIIDPEFRDKIPPLSADEFSKLEENIVADGEVREPLVVWNNTIIDGHHRWAIIQKHPEIPYKLKQMDFPDKWAAIVWMCRNQLGRRNITDEVRTVLIGEAYRAQKMSVGNHAEKKRNENGQFTVSDQSGHIWQNRTRKDIAKQFNVGEGTVQRSEIYVDGLDAAEKVSPGFKESVLSGAVKAPKSMISEIRNIPEENRSKVVEAIKKGDTDTAKSFIQKKPIPTQKEERQEYDTKDFYGDLSSAVKNFDFALRQHMVLVHRNMLDTEKGREVAMKALQDGQTVIEKYISMIRMVAENG